MHGIYDDGDGAVYLPERAYGCDKNSTSDTRTSDTSTQHSTRSGTPAATLNSP